MSQEGSVAQLMDRASGTWIEPMVVINSQPWGIVYWFKRLPVQTTYLFLQAFLKYFYSQEMLTTSDIKFKLHLKLTLSVELQKVFDVLWRKLRSKWVELVSVKRCTCLFTNTLKMITRRITSLILFRCRNYLQFFTFWIFFNPTNYANLYLTTCIYSFILECLQYQNYGLRWNKRDLFTITA